MKINSPSKFSSGSKRIWLLTVTRGLAKQKVKFCTFCQREFASQRRIKLVLAFRPYADPSPSCCRGAHKIRASFVLQRSGRTVPRQHICIANELGIVDVKQIAEFGQASGENVSRILDARDTRPRRRVRFGEVQECCCQSCREPENQPDFRSRLACESFARTTALFASAASEMNRRS